MVCSLRRQVKASIFAIGRNLRISEPSLNTLARKFDSAHHESNLDRLKRVFNDVGVSLSKSDEDVLKSRNDCFHGRSADSLIRDLSWKNEEAKRFDTLRTLINRAVRMLVGYSGPYVDYSARPTSGGFPIVEIEGL